VDTIVGVTINGHEFLKMDASEDRLNREIFADVRKG